MVVAHFPFLTPLLLLLLLESTSSAKWGNRMTNAKPSPPPPNCGGIDPTIPLLFTGTVLLFLLAFALRRVSQLLVFSLSPLLSKSRKKKTKKGTTRRVEVGDDDNAAREEEGEREETMARHIADILKEYDFAERHVGNDSTTTVVKHDTKHD